MLQPIVKWSFYPSVSVAKLNSLIGEDLLLTSDLHRLSGSVTFDFARKISWVSCAQGTYTILLNSPYCFLVRHKLVDATDVIIYFNVYRRILNKKHVCTGYLVVENSGNSERSREVYVLFDFAEARLKVKHSTSTNASDVLDDFGNASNTPNVMCYEHEFFSFEVI